MKNPNKCHCGGCKSERVIVMSTLWGKKDGEYQTCEKHTPEWAKGKPVGTFSPIASLFGITKSFYQIKFKA